MQGNIKVVGGFYVVEHVVKHRIVDDDRAQDRLLRFGTEGQIGRIVIAGKGIVSHRVPLKICVSR